MEIPPETRIAVYRYKQTVCRCILLGNYWYMSVTSNILQRRQNLTESKILVSYNFRYGERSVSGHDIASAAVYL